MPCGKARGAMWLPCARLPSLRGGAPLCRACEAPPEGTVLPSLRGSLRLSRRACEAAVLQDMGEVREVF